MYKKRDHWFIVAMEVLMGEIINVQTDSFVLAKFLLLKILLHY